MKAALLQLPAVKEWSTEKGVLSVQVEDEEKIPDLVTAITAAGGRIYRVHPKLHSLTDIYFRIQEDLRLKQGGTQ